MKNVQPLIIFLLYVTVSILVFNPFLFEGGDNVKYMLLAESLTHGSYQDIHIIGSPLHTQYPPVLPLLLALPYALFGHNLLAYKLLILLMSFVAYWVFCGIVQRLLPDHQKPRTLTLAFFVSLPVMSTYNHYVLSEIPFMLFLLLAVYFIIKKQYMASALSAGIMTLTRTIGFVWIVALAIYRIQRKQYKLLAREAGVFLILTVPWVVYTFLNRSQYGYLSQIAWRDPRVLSIGNISAYDLLVRVGYNFMAYVIQLIPRSLVAITNLNEPHIAFAGIGLLIAGLLLMSWSSLKVRCPQMAYFIIAYMAVILLWPELWTTERFIIPILPLLVIGLMFMVRIMPYWTRTVVWLVIALNLACCVMLSTNKTQSQWFEEMQLGYIMNRNNDTPVVVKPEFYYWFTGRQAVKKR